jgi:hypothetical protein
MEGASAAGVVTMQSTRRDREELRTTLIEEGREILFTEGLKAGSSSLTFKRVFDRVEAKTGLRITNASVIKRIWENQAPMCSSPSLETRNGGPREVASEWLPC